MRQDKGRHTVKFVCKETNAVILPESNHFKLNEVDSPTLAYHVLYLNNPQNDDKCLNWVW